MALCSDPTCAGARLIVTTRGAARARNGARMLADKKLAVLGTGMMGSALARGLTQAGSMSPKNIVLYDVHSLKAQQVAREIGEGVSVAETAADAATSAALVLHAVKPPI